MGKFDQEYKMSEDSFVGFKPKPKLKLLLVMCVLLVLVVLVSVIAYLFHNQELINEPIVEPKSGDVVHCVISDQLSTSILVLPKNSGGPDEVDQVEITEGDQEEITEGGQEGITEGDQAEITDCFEPFPVNHGMWHCRELNYTEAENGFLSLETPALTCILECDPGYTHSKRTFTSCAGGRWSTPLGQMTCPTAIALITGGYPKQQTVEIYPRGGINISLPNLPDEREDHTVDRVDGIALLCGGSLDFNNIVRTCLKLNINELKFSPHSTLISDRKFHSSIISGQQLILIGGGDTKLSTSSSVSTEFLFPRISTEWTLGYPLLEGTEFACTVKAYKNFYIAIGGLYKQDQKTYKFSDHVVQYNIEDGTSTRLANLLSGRDGHGCVLVKNNTFEGILVTGGHSNDADLPLVSTEMLNLKTLTWHEMGRLHIGRYGLEMVVLGDRILAMGGKDKDHKSIASVEQLNMTTGMWRKTKDMQEERASYAVTTIPRCYVDQNTC